MDREKQLRSRIKFFTSLFVIGLVISGATAIPLVSEVDFLVKISGAQAVLDRSGTDAMAWAGWLTRVQTALGNVHTTYPFLFYGTDWLAFGHFIIAVAFVGALREPVRNRWLFDFGLVACVLVIPYALIFGAVRGIPFWWRLIDCSFGVFGFIPLWWCRIWARELESNRSTG